MRKPFVWTGVAAGAIAGACSRVMGFAFGKALAFTYAVIVSMVANVVIDLVREPPHLTPPEQVAGVVVGEGAALPAAAMAVPAAAAPMAQHRGSAVPTAPPPDGGRPGPGSGGLY